MLVHSVICFLQRHMYQMYFLLVFLLDCSFRNSHDSTRSISFYLKLQFQIQLNLQNWPPKMSSLGDCLWEVVAYRSFDHLWSKFMSLAYGNCRDLSHVLMFYSCEESILRKNSVLPIEKFASLVLPRNAIMLQHLIIQFLLYYWSGGCL